MTYNGTNRKDIRAAEKAADIAEANRIAYTRQIMSTQPGRAWMYNLLTRTMSFHEPFVVGRPDATAYNLGRASVGRPIFDDVFTHCPQHYTLMMQEAQAKDEANAARSANHADESDAAERGRSAAAFRGRHDPSAGYDIAPTGFVYDESNASANDGDEVGPAGEADFS